MLSHRIVVITKRKSLKKAFDMNETTRHRTGKRFFIYAPAVKGIRSKATGEYVSARLRRIGDAFSGAEAWQNNVFYFWWEFLKRHEGYRDCCERNGAGKYKKLYADWGNIHAYETKDFWKWWSEKVSSTETRGEYLFAEPDARELQIADKLKKSEKVDTLLVAVPAEVRTAYLVAMFRRLLRDHKEQVAAARRISRARYPVGANVRLATLYQTLRVYDVWQENKNTKLKKYELADLAGVYVNHVVNGETEASLRRAGFSEVADVVNTVRRRKTQSFNRHLEAAEDYIENSVKGSFPVRSNISQVRVLQ